LKSSFVPSSTFNPPNRPKRDRCAESAAHRPSLDQKLPIGRPRSAGNQTNHADIEVIIITGYGSLRSAMEGIRHGAAGYLLKPFNVTELITLVNQTLEKTAAQTIFAAISGSMVSGV
jgi:DNA-binding NarL/FixJ family response regulator